MTRSWWISLRVIILVGLIIGLSARVGRTDPPQPPFPAFQQALDKRLTARGFDPEHQTYHFVILMDNVRSADPAGEGMDAIVNGLLDHYLVGTDEASDEISFATFQLGVLPDHTHWNLPFSVANVQSIKQLIPLGPEPEGTHEGGNDKEAALLLALKTVTDPQKAIYIVLGDTEKSQTPTNEPGYPLSRNSADFKQVAGKFNMVSWIPMSLPTVGPNPQPIYFRVYLPDGLTPLGVLNQTTRSALLAQVGTPAVPATPVPAVTIPPSVATPTIEHTPSTPFPVGEILEAVFAGLIIGGALWYFLWLRAPRHVQVGPAHDSVRSGTPLYVVADGDQLTLTSKAGGMKIARLEVIPNGEVVMQGESFYTLPKEKVVLTNKAKTYWLKDNRTGEDTYELNARRVR